MGAYYEHKHLVVNFEKNFKNVQCEYTQSKNERALLYARFIPLQCCLKQMVSK